MNTTTASVTLYSLLRTAQQAGLARPTIKLPYKESILRFALSTRYPGSVNINYGEAWVGALKRDGSFAWNIRYQAVPGGYNAPPYEMREFLRKLAEDSSLIETLAATGRRVSWCCFCGRGLTTKESVAAGYGPICAEKFGLPWGEDPQPAIQELSPEDI